MPIAEPPELGETNGHSARTGPGTRQAKLADCAGCTALHGRSRAGPSRGRHADAEPDTPRRQRLERIDSGGELHGVPVRDICNQDAEIDDPSECPGDMKDKRMLARELSWMG